LGVQQTENLEITVEDTKGLLQKINVPDLIHPTILKELATEIAEPLTVYTTKLLERGTN